MTHTGSRRELVFERITFPEPRSFRSAVQVAAEAILRHPEATGAVLVEDADWIDKVSAVEIVNTWGRGNGVPPPLPSDLQHFADSYRAAVVEPRERLRQEAAERRKEQAADRAARRRKAKTAPFLDEESETLPTDEEIEEAARRDATVEAVLNVRPTPRAVRARMSAAQRRADTLARVAEQKKRFAEVLAARKAERLAEREAKRAKAKE